jgi:hypothetical protein
MGLMAHVKIVESEDKAVLSAPADLIGKYEPKGKSTAKSSAVAYAIPDHGSINMATLRVRLKGVPVRIAEKAFQSVPAGSFIVDAGSFAKVQTEAVALGLDVVPLDAEPSVPMHEAAMPRLAVYSTWGSTQDVGWVRYAFDYFETPYDLIFKERVKSGNLRGDYDVIVIPSQGRSSKTLVYDIAPKEKPLAYAKTEKFRFLGDYGSSDDITGGMGLEGAAEFRKFVEQGGVLITLGEASAFPPDYGITRTIDSSRPGAQFYAPGPIVNAEILQPANPVFYGYEEKKIPVRWAGGPLLSVPRKDRDEQVLMRFPGGDDNVLSGVMRGAAEIRNRPAIVDVPVGDGRVLLFATNPCYRWQNFGEFRMLFNAILNYKSMK